VSKIYPRKDERTQTFKIEAIFSQPPDVLYPGLAGEGNIVVGKKENAMTIPREYLADEDQVLTKDGKKGWQLIHPATGEIEKFKVQDELKEKVYDGSDYGLELKQALIETLMKSEEVIE